MQYEIMKVLHQDEKGKYSTDTKKEGITNLQESVVTTGSMSILI